MPSGLPVLPERANEPFPESYAKTVPTMPSVFGSSRTRSTTRAKRVDVEKINGAADRDQNRRGASRA